MEKPVTTRSFRGICTGAWDGWVEHPVNLRCLGMPFGVQQEEEEQEEEEQEQEEQEEQEEQQQQQQQQQPNARVFS